MLDFPCSSPSLKSCFVVYSSTSPTTHWLILTGRYFYWLAVLDISHFKARIKAHFASFLPSWRKRICCLFFLSHTKKKKKTKQSKLLGIKESPPLFFVSYCCRDQALWIIQHKVWGEMETSSREGTLRSYVARHTLRSPHHRWRLSSWWWPKPVWGRDWCE